MPRASQHRALAYKQTKIKHGVALGVTVLITVVSAHNFPIHKNMFYNIVMHQHFSKCIQK